MTNICLHIIDLQSDDIDNVFQITIYGKTLENQNIVCHVTDFKPSFYVKIPEKWDKNKFQANIINNLDISKYEKTKYKIFIEPSEYYYDFY